SFVQIFFREERLPIAEGWSRSKTMITTETMSPIQNLAIQTANGGPTQACEPLVFGPNATL
ncbi:hypothetical protein B0H17DRAFT_921826, partial [Mycena rosella]